MLDILAGTPSELGPLTTTHRYNYVTRALESILAVLIPLLSSRKFTCEQDDKERHNQLTQQLDPPTPTCLGNKRSHERVHNMT